MLHFNFLTCYFIAKFLRVAHLILADPWGFPERPADYKPNIPTPFKILAWVTHRLNPFWALRLAGPWGRFKNIELI